MSSHMTPGQLLAALARQHADLRARIALCEQLADRFDADLVEPALLLREVTALRAALEDHNRFEERALGSILLDADALGAARTARMVEDHVEEHRALRRDLDLGKASELRAVLAGLRRHLEDEERYFVIRSRLSDDLAG
jgi:hypothetical protein